MVTNSRAPLGARSFQPLNTPRPIRVETDSAGRPRAVRRPGWPSARAIVRIQDCWRIDDEWWRERPIARLYYTVVVTGDHVLTIGRDLIADSWFEQSEWAGGALPPVFSQRERGPLGGGDRA